MPVTDAYASATTYRALLSKTDTTKDVEILDDLTAVSRYLDWKLERFFTVDASVVTRTYVPSVYSDTLIVDDISTTTGLVIKVDTNRNGLFSDESAWATTDYELLPRNNALGPEPKPYTAIFIPSWSSKGSWMPGYPVQVTAKFGWPAIPKAIERATCHLTGILRLESPRATERTAEGIDRAVGQSPKAKGILEELKAAYARPSVFS
jgi:hypothetical protein